MTSIHYNGGSYTEAFSPPQPCCRLAGGWSRSQAVSGERWITLRNITLSQSENPEETHAGQQASTQNLPAVSANHCTTMPPTYKQCSSVDCVKQKRLLL